MKTPYDPAIRIGRREVEAIRVSLRAELIRVTELEQERIHLDERIVQECASASADWQISTYDWLRARKAQARKIDATRAEAEAELSRLRDKAGEAYGRLHATEKAADIHIDRAQKEKLRREQEESDDLANARRLLRLRAQWRHDSTRRRNGGY